jgi:hypothetical protein
MVPAPVEQCSGPSSSGENALCVVSGIYSLSPCELCNGTYLVESVDSLVCAACCGTGKILGGSCICCNGLGEQEVRVKEYCPSCMEKD